MVKFEKVKPEEVANALVSRKGRTSWPILKMFIETGMHTAKVDRASITSCKDTSAIHLYQLLMSYLKRNPEIPVVVLKMNKELYLQRLDIDEEENPIKDWQKKKEQTLPEQGEPQDIDDDIIEEH